jgi:hypothetical protein
MVVGHGEAGRRRFAEEDDAPDLVGRLPLGSVKRLPPAAVRHICTAFSSPHVHIASSMNMVAIISMMPL